MPRKKKRRGRKQRKRYRFTRSDCQKGYRAALAKCEQAGVDRLAWFLRRVRGYYDEQRRMESGEDPRKTEERRRAYFGGWYAGNGGCSRDPLTGNEPPF